MRERCGIAVGHVESGLRSFDRTMPEEINRIVADHFSELLFTHSPEAEDNLRAEGVDLSRLHFVGNTMIDTLVALEERFRARGAARELGVEPGSYLLVTLHRPALVDGPALADAIAALGEVGEAAPGHLPGAPAHALEAGRAASGERSPRRSGRAISTSSLWRPMRPRC